MSQNCTSINKNLHQSLTKSNRKGSNVHQNECEYELHLFIFNIKIFGIFYELVSLYKATRNYTDFQGFPKKKLGFPVFFI